ncbi:MAG: hypothetical protein R6V45_02545 [Oceanipulchritudo sp.]
MQQLLFWKGPFARLLACLVPLVINAGTDPKPTHQPAEWNSSNPEVFAYEDLVSNYWDLYPRGEATVIETIRPLPDAVGLELVLRSDRPDFSHFLYTLDSGPEMKSADGRIRLQFEDNHTLEDHSTERIELLVWSVDSKGQRSSPNYLKTNFYPSERYQASGRLEDGHSRIHIRETDLQMATSDLGDWILDEPGEADIAFARETWGHLIDPNRSDYANALALAQTLVAELTPHRGTPSDAMDSLRPFDQYRRLIAGKDRCWCANISEIFSFASNAFGIPTRFIIMRHQLYPPPSTGEEGYEILMATGHTTNEVFDRSTGKWIWMDLTLNVFGAWLDDTGPLNMLDFHHFLNRPAFYPRLQIDLYDPETDTLQRIPLDESPVRTNALNAYKQDQLFRYMRKPR